MYTNAELFLFAANAAQKEAQIMDTLVTSAVELCKKGLSLKQIGRELNISEQKVRKILITAGLWSSETCEKVAALEKKGCSIDQIASEVHLTRNAVLSYMPYDRGMQNAETPTANALRIRKCRERKAKEKAQLEEQTHEK